MATVTGFTSAKTQELIDSIGAGVYTTAARPAANTVPIGSKYYDTSLHKPLWSDGVNWRDAMGTVV